ncbi:uncharacterized protein [Polyergus mexicanus]|uniref:uncharacterized protein n=1 Tax=Polyergus mexicanus TaxID=615972 RepID=UPI0038B48982
MCLISQCAIATCPIVLCASEGFSSIKPLDHSNRWGGQLINGTTEFPRFGELTEFLQNRVRALEAAGSKQHLIAIGSPPPSKKHQRRSDVYAHATAASSKSWDSRSSCPLCQELHALRACAKFKAYPVEQRRDCIRKRRACFNCLGSDHNASSCPSANRCRQCQSKHHTLLHFKDDATARATATADGTPDHEDGIMTPESSTTKAFNSTISVLSSSTRGCVLLATARVVLMGESGRSVNVRALLDSGSEASFVSERAAQLLKLARRRVRVAVSGLQGAATGTASHTVSVMIGTHRSPSVRIAEPRALVLPKLTSLIPGHRFAVRNWPHLKGLDLADPEFAVPAAVDCVLGADIYGLLCESGHRIGPPGSPSAHQMIFGWVLMGPVSDIRPKSDTSVSSLHITTFHDLNQDLQRFWRLDEVPEGRILTSEEKACEDLFVKTHTRDASGRYIARLPRKKDPSNLLGASRPSAFRLLQSNERRFCRDETLRHQYREFMFSYISLSHMEVIPRGDSQTAESFYMPHHAVIKHSDSSDKIRVVFNASYRSSTGVSLNDLLVPGPKLQSEL